MFDFHKKCRAEVQALQGVITDLARMLRESYDVIINRRSMVMRSTLTQSLNLLIDELEKKEQAFDEAATILWKIVGGEPVDENFREAIKAFCGKLVPTGVPL